MSTQQVSNDRAAVTEWRLATGSETGWHVHGHDYIVVPLTDGEHASSEPTEGETARHRMMCASLRIAQRRMVRDSIRP